MVDINQLERALLVKIVIDKDWEVIILNGITENYFTYANRPLFRYIKEYVDKDIYPEIKAIQFKFGVTDDEIADYMNVSELQSLCDQLKLQYAENQIEYELGKLNEISDLSRTDPVSYINNLGDAYSRLKTLGYSNKSVGLFDDIEKILQIDPNDVISTGFKELDEKLIGWKRGEELVVFMARTGQGKSWMGLKFALSAALQGERVGIYSGEMSLQQLQERIICCAKQTYTSTPEDSLQFLKEHDPQIRLLTQKESRRRENVNDLEEMIIKDKLTMLVVDQLSMMEDVNLKYGTPLRQQYGNITNDLFDLTQKYNLPIILLVQSNRQGSQQQNGPALENIAESDAVAQNATRVISMKNEAGILTMNIIKNRYGESGLTQKYEVDYGINKYRPIRDLAQEAAPLKRAKARSIFENNKYKGKF